MAVSIAVTSGKGGVGKTNSAVNLALTLGKAGQNVLLFDADFGLANTHIMLGCHPTRTVADFLNGTASLEETITNVGENVQLEAPFAAFLEAGIAMDASIVGAGQIVKELLQLRLEQGDVAIGEYN